MRFLISICICLYAFFGISQEEIQIDIEPLLITHNHEDSLHISNEAGALKNLEFQKGSHLQSNGPGLLSTLLFNGLAARHTAILWNDWNIQSPVNSTYDLSMIPDLFHQVSSSSQSKSYLLGNASMGGFLDLGHLTNPEFSTELSLDYSTLNNSKIQLLHGQSKEKWSAKFGVEMDFNKNRFNYEYNNARFQQDNNSYNSLQYIGNLKTQISNNTSLAFNVWHQWIQREVGPSKSSSYNGAEQVDKNLRINTKMNYNSNTWTSSLNVGYFKEYLEFDDLAIDESIAKNQSVMSRWSIKKYFSNDLRISSLVNYRKDRTDANFFNEIQNRTNIGGSLSIQDEWSGGRIKPEATIRFDQYSAHGEVFTYNIGVNGSIRNNFDYTITHSKSFQLPSLNDLYWPNGGNLLLEPEINYSWDLRLVYRKKNFEIESQIFLNHIDNWIQWTLNDQLIWSPLNIAKVRTYGYDIGLKHHRSIGKTKWLWNLNVNLTNTEILEHQTITEYVGNQLIYIPRYKIVNRIHAEVGKWSFNLDQLFVSERFTSFDNSERLVAEKYFINDLSLHYDLSEINRYLTSVSIKCHNLFNQDYEVVRFFGMPLRYWSFSTKFNL